MDLCYRQHRYEQLLHQGNNFNAHNLFLQITISSGFIGLLFFLAAFLYPCMIAIQHRNWEYLFFILILLGTGITESHFNRNAVVLLFAFLNPLIFVLDLKTKDENTPDT